jgi:hypothetical protein
MQMDENAPIDKESITKLNGEINIYLNQQYVLFVSAVTLTGAVMAWVSQHIDPLNAAPLQIGFLAFAALSFFLLIVAVLEARLEIAMAICAIYLRMTGVSAWERDVERFRIASGRRTGLTTRGTFYIGVGLLVFVWPFLLSLVAYHSVSLSILVFAHGASSLFYFLGVFFLIPWGVTLRVNQIENSWTKALNGKMPSAS